MPYKAERQYNRKYVVINSSDKYFHMLLEKFLFIYHVVYISHILFIVKMKKL
jgi:hypothetical protein